MDKLLSMRVFNSVVELGSFVRAAEHLDMSPAVVSRHIATLEKHLGAQLLVRTTRSLSLTERGAIYFERCRHLIDEIEAMESLVRSATKAYSGMLKLATTVNFGLHFLPSIISDFQKIYPEITFDVMLTDEPIDFAATGRDLAITVPENILHPDTVTRKLVPTRTVLCATPEYLRKHPPLKTPADLTRHRCIVLAANPSGSLVWQLQGKDGSIKSVPIKPAIVCNIGAMAYECVFNHLGIGIFTSTLLAKKAIDNGTLRTVLDDYELPNKEVVIAYPTRRYVTSKARAFIDFLIDAVFSGMPIGRDANQSLIR